MASTPAPRVASGSATSSCPPAHSRPLELSAITLVDATQAQRERERRSRLNRIRKYEKMQAYASSLERTALALRVASDADSIWDEFLDEDTKSTRTYLRRLIAVSDSVKQLTIEKTELQRLLTERELARRAVARMVELMEVADKWSASCAMWKALARIHFRPLTTSECAKLIEAAILDMAEYEVRQDKESTGMAILGWRENRRHLPNKSSLQFSLDKVFRGYDLTHHAEMIWRVYSDPELYAKVVLGGRGRVSMDILQEVSPTAWVIRTTELYDAMDVAVHELYLLFSIKTDDGAMVYVRAIEDADLERAFNAPTDMWTSNYYWMRWEVFDPSKDWAETDYRVYAGGCMRGGDSAFLHRWLFELVAVLVRSESIVTGRAMLKFE